MPIANGSKAVRGKTRQHLRRENNANEYKHKLSLYYRMLTYIGKYVRINRSNNDEKSFLLNSFQKVD